MFSNVSDVSFLNIYNKANAVFITMEQNFKSEASNAQKPLF